MFIFFIRIFVLMSIAIITAWWILFVIKQDKKEKLNQAIEEKREQEKLNKIANKKNKDVDKIIKESEKRDSFIDKFIDN